MKSDKKKRIFGHIVNKHEIRDNVSVNSFEFY